MKQAHSPPRVMAKSTIVALALIASVPALAQDGGMPPDAEQPPPDIGPGAPAAETYAEWDEVEVYDSVNELWDKCVVLAVYKGAYKVSCNYTHSIQRDINVRKPGGSAASHTAAQRVNGPPFKRGDLALVSPMGLPNDWRLCVVLRDEVAQFNRYVVDCGNQNSALPKWIRKDPKAPQ